MKILIVGGGGREHALAWKTAQSPVVTQIYVAPGNAGTALENKVENTPIAAENIPALLQFAKQNQIDLTIVGPEVPLVAGIVDIFSEAGIRCFGPSRAAAQLEGSKTFCKDFLARHNIPTAEYQTFTDPEKASSYVREKGAPIVVKADGLAAGKGVVLAQTEEEALTAVQDMLSGNVFGDAGHRVVIEEFLLGEEASFIVISDSNNVLPMASSQDHKARDNGDTGPNTGGMGAYSPAPAVTPAAYKRIMTEVINPTIKGMSDDGIPYTGFLYAGVMIDPKGNPKVLEYNCRLGDPETQPILMRLKSDLVALCNSALDKKLDSVKAEWDSRAALGVVMTSGGYPDAYQKGTPISGLPAPDSIESKVFHAGTIARNGDILTSGGRVLCACAMGKSVSLAQHKAYEIVRGISWDNAYYRTDIGYRAIERE
ncbi:MAG: phosphoribosylamine--glycine ligase [Methylococcales bacterium]